jgi:hypothetical protein
MYPAFDWSVSLLAIMGISAGAITLAERPDGPFGSPVFAHAGKPNLLLVSFFRRPRWTCRRLLRRFDDYLLLQRLAEIVSALT